jgi:uncharacterized protein DUF5906/TOTE conflict system primase-like protein/primase-like protein
MSDPDDRSEAGRADQLEFLRALADHMRTDLYNEFNVAKGSGYQHVKATVLESVIGRHLANEQPIALFPVIKNQVRVAVLDIDNHDGALTWEQVVERVLPIWTELVGGNFRPLAFRSGGGSGIHIWLVWEKPQSAKAVRRYLRVLLGHHRLADGAAGISSGAVEVYPKQDRVAEDGVGNPIALPLARKSLPLDSDLQPLADYSPPSIKDHYGPDLPPVVEGDRQRPAEGRPNAANVATLHEVLDGDLEEAVAALRQVPADDFHVWVQIGLILKRSFGENGFALWNTWSGAASDKYPGEAEIRRVWDGLRPSGVLGLGTLFRLARQAGWNGPTDPHVREMNARFGILTHRNKTLVILKNGDRQEDDEFEWLTKPVFEDRLRAEKVERTDAQGNPLPISKVRFWFDHKRASRYHRIDFDPGKPPGTNGKTWNTWTGFGVDPIPGDWGLLQNHILHNVCAGDDELFRWLMNWMALGVQQPGLVIGTAPVLKGFPGTGKGVIANAYGRLWGAHYTAITNQAHVSGRFNSHLFGRRFVFIDEGTFGGNRREAGVIKTRITEPWIILEAKGVDPIRIRNRMIFMIASNEDSIVPADKADRRWQVFEVGNRNREDHGYFRQIVDQLKDGGYEAMLYDLLRRDQTTKPNPRRVIKTEALFEQIIRAQGAEVRYLHQILDSGYLPQQVAFGNGSNATTIKALWMDLRKTQANSQYVSLVGLGRFLNLVIPGIKSSQNGEYIIRMNLGQGSDETERSTRHQFPALPICRAAFERYIGQPVPWTNELQAWLPEPGLEAI